MSPRMSPLHFYANVKPTIVLSGSTHTSIHEKERKNEVEGKRIISTRMNEKMGRGNRKKRQGEKENDTNHNIIDE